MKILKASAAHIPAIIALAKKTWYATYTELVPEGQIEYMLELFYNEPLLQQQMQDPQHHFLIMTENEKISGYSHCIEQHEKIKLSKLYFSPEQQGRGLGKLLLAEIERQAKSTGYYLIELCVNRGNKAQFFYEKAGFEIVQEIDIPIGDFFMNDYLMQKKLAS